MNDLHTKTLTRIGGLDSDVSSSVPAPINPKRLHSGIALPDNMQVFTKVKRLSSVTPSSDAVRIRYEVRPELRPEPNVFLLGRQCQNPQPQNNL